MLNCPVVCCLTQLMTVLLLLVAVEGFLAHLFVHSNLAPTAVWNLLLCSICHALLSAIVLDDWHKKWLIKDIHVLSLKCHILLGVIAMLVQTFQFVATGRARGVWRLLTFSSSKCAFISAISSSSSLLERLGLCSCVAMYLRSCCSQLYLFCLSYIYFASAIFILPQLYLFCLSYIYFASAIFILPLLYLFCLSYIYFASAIFILPLLYLFCLSYIYFASAIFILPQLYLFCLSYIHFASAIFILPQLYLFCLSYSIFILPQLYLFCLSYIYFASAIFILPQLYLFCLSYIYFASAIFILPQLYLFCNLLSKTVNFFFFNECCK